MAKKNKTHVVATVKTAAPKAAPAKKNGGPAAPKAAPAKVAPAAPKGKTATPATKAAPTFRRETVKDKAIALMSRPKGASIDELMETFGWLRHTTRGFVSVLGKTHTVESLAVDGVRTYRVKGVK